MADKTEAPTPRRLARARREGDVASARPIGEVVALAAVVAVSPAALRALSAQVNDWLGRALTEPTGWVDAAALGSTVVETVAPLVGLAGAASFLTTWAIQGGVWTPRPLAPRFDRLSFTNAASELFSLPRFFAGIRTMIAAAGALALSIWILSRAAAGLADTVGSLPLSVEGAATIVLRLSLTCLALFALLATAEWFVIRRHHLGRLRMTRTEITRERRDAEGDPEMKRARRRAHEALAQDLPLSDLGKAALVFADGYRLSVAIAYDAATDRAPQILLSGRGDAAAAIIRACATHHIRVVDDAKTARELEAVGNGREIPASLYGAVAEALGAGDPRHPSTAP